MLKKKKTSDHDILTPTSDTNKAHHISVSFWGFWENILSVWEKKEKTEIKYDHSPGHYHCLWSGLEFIARPSIAGIKGKNLHNSIFWRREIKNARHFNFFSWERICLKMGLVVLKGTSNVGLGVRETKISPLVSKASYAAPQCKTKTVPVL